MSTYTTYTCDQCGKEITRSACRITVDVIRINSTYSVSRDGAIYSDGSSFRGGDFCDLNCLLEKAKQTNFQ